MSKVCWRCGHWFRLWRRLSHIGHPAAKKTLYHTINRIIRTDSDDERTKSRDHDSLNHEATSSHHTKRYKNKINRLKTRTSKREQISPENFRPCT